MKNLSSVKLGTAVLSVALIGLAAMDGTAGADVRVARAQAWSTGNTARSTVVTNPLTTRALNPQPLPPKTIQRFGTSGVEYRMLNPQPLPPKAVQLNSTSDSGARMLNPQPLPPKAIASESVTLNPQPLPPKAQVYIPRVENDAKLSTGELTSSDRLGNYEIQDLTSAFDAASKLQKQIEDKMDELNSRRSSSCNRNVGCDITNSQGRFVLVAPVGTRAAMQQ